MSRRGDYNGGSTLVGRGSNWFSYRKPKKHQEEARKRAKARRTQDHVAVWAPVNPEVRLLVSVSQEPSPVADALENRIVLPRREFLAALGDRRFWRANRSQGDVAIYREDGKIVLKTSVSCHHLPLRGQWDVHVLVHPMTLVSAAARTLATRSAIVLEYKQGRILLENGRYSVDAREASPTSS